VFKELQQKLTLFLTVVFQWSNSELTYATSSSLTVSILFCRTATKSSLVPTSFVTFPFTVLIDF